ncbi:MarR family transcriptional regulator [Flavobacteriaceae bacterium]|jgi:DNA-binding MarR family transcriptional regulator|nr:MarR family transcriptional regulator [Flavobacteriaceae bacterium]MDB2672541.1 MarR family transcriptional regulator [Flavobacteriaceae bacterium]MDB4186453.1 MarR family transcriptional regulator [Flavobacteriaceae bacterium]MDB9821928.1 MarR family transcriptional regulator [Flavobacteriaceae bacterium]MDC0014427.1 MarR family transcriptional regulator [Flavobacteriaceae bacterium]
MSKQLTKETVISLLRSGYKVNDELSALFKIHGISLPQFNVLRILRGRKGEAANLSTIQEQMIHKMSNTTRLIDKLIEGGYVNRFVCEKNRRKIEIFITKKGLEFLNSLDEKLETKERFLMNNLDNKEKEELMRLLSKIQTSITSENNF